MLTRHHSGTGQELGIVDLPIQRERHTGFPKIEASGLKGSIREAFEENNNEVKIGDKKIQVNDINTISLAFGPVTDITHAGALGFTDARILLFPVKSMKGVFAYITCPQVLKRFEEEITIAGKEIELNGQKINVSKISPNSFPENTSKVLVSAKVILEEYTF